MKIASLAVSLFLAVGIAQAAAPSPPQLPIRINKTVTGQRIVVPLKPDVIFNTAVFAHGWKLPVHKHLYPHYVYVEDGTLTLVNTETHTSTDIPTGSFVAEPINTWHYGTNNGTVPLRLVLIDQVPHGVAKNMVLQAP